jgi:hypothetical protein
MTMPDNLTTVTVTVSDANGRRTEFTASEPGRMPLARQADLAAELADALGNYLNAEAEPVPPTNYVG